MLETEYKEIIDETTYRKLENAYNWDWTAEQTNSYYFSKLPEFAKSKTMVRIREKNGIFKIQVKKHHPSKKSLHISEETEFDIDSAVPVIDAETAKKITGIDSGELHKYGSLTTLRHSLMWNDTTEICLDKSTYLDRTDYEIEVEYTGEMPEKLKEELNGLGISFKEFTPGKFSRFTQRLNELKSK